MRVFWLCWVFTTMPGLSLVAASGDCPLLQCVASRRADFSCCERGFWATQASVVVAPRLWNISSGVAVMGLAEFTHWFIYWANWNDYTVFGIIQKQRKVCDIWRSYIIRVCQGPLKIHEFYGRVILGKIKKKKLGQIFGSGDNKKPDLWKFCDASLFSQFLTRIITYHLTFPLEGLKYISD